MRLVSKTLDRQANRPKRVGVNALHRSVACFVARGETILYGHVSDQKVPFTPKTQLAPYSWYCRSVRD